jgi:hypothetical protein
MRKTVLAAALSLATIVAVSPAFAACDTINSRNVKLSACVDENDWVIQAPQGDQEYLYFSSDDKVGFTIITEKQTFSASEFRSAVLINARNANNGADPRVVSERVENVSEKPWNFIEYQFGAAGQDLEFQNFYYSQPGFGAVQMVFWSLPADATVAAYRAGVLLSTLKYGN